MDNIIQKPSPNFGSRHGYAPKAIVIHVMDGSLTGTFLWFQNPLSGVSSHYGVGLRGEIHQYIQDSDEAWTEGNVRNPSSKIVLSMPHVNPNFFCISIENEGHDLSLGTPEQLNASTSLVASLITQYGIPCDRDHIIGHYEVDSVVKSNCPTPDRTFMDRYVKMVELLVNKNKKTMNATNGAYKFVNKEDGTVKYGELFSAKDENGNVVFRTADEDITVKDNYLPGESTLNVNGVNDNDAHDFVSDKYDISYDFDYRGELPTWEAE